MGQKVKFFRRFFVCPTVLAILLIGARDGGNIWDGIRSLFYNEPHPETFMTTPQIITSLGYPVEEHKVTTKGGYILTIFRIPAGGSNGRPRPVIIQHGILCSSVDWVRHGHDSLRTVINRTLNVNSHNYFKLTLAMQLADNGHEVWLTNTRGNHYCQEHETLHQDDAKFWDFSFDEVGKEDVPSVISYILETSRADSVNWVSHSMGCTMLFVAIDQDPSLNAKVNKMTCMAPAVYLKHARSPILRFASYLPTSVFRGFFDYLGNGRFLLSSLTDYSPYFCSGKIATEFCITLYFLVVGFNREQLMEKTSKWDHVPSQTSAKIMAHFMQFVRSEKFQAFDYGEAGNFEKYGSLSPPAYNLSKVTVPIQAFYGPNDWVVQPQDARQTLSEVGNVTESIEVEHTGWNHADSTIGLSAPVLIFKRIVKFMEL